MPISAEQFEKGGEMTWEQKEEHVRKILEKEFRKKLPNKKNVIVGYTKEGEPNYKEFDLYADDGSIVGQVKSGKDMRDYRLAECCMDCLYLMSEGMKEAGKRIFVLTNEEMYDWFLKKISGLPINDIEIRLIKC
ncbi:MAG: hypothetical protein KAT65_18985 [Methanophagales archaeon]|nr:hypothetical protein [Methanophagales archaeon]